MPVTNMSPATNTRTGRGSLALRLAALLLLAAPALPARVAFVEYPADLYVEARQAALDGMLTEAEGLWAQMLASLEGPLYTVDLATACGDQAAMEILDRLRGVHPVFSVASSEGSGGCHRILFGLFPGEEGLDELVVYLPAVSLYPPTLVRIEKNETMRPTLHEVRRFLARPAAPPADLEPEPGPAGSEPQVAQPTAPRQASPAAEPVAEKPTTTEPGPAPAEEPEPPQEARDWFREGKQALMDSDPKAAEEAFLKVLESDPQNVSALHNLGVALLYQQKFDLAANRFMEAIEIDPLYVRAYVNLSAALFALGGPEDAIEVLEKALEFAPDDFEVHYTLAGMNAEAERFGPAHVHLTKALSIRPTDARALALRRALPPPPPGTDVVPPEPREASAPPATEPATARAEGSRLALPSGSLSDAGFQRTTPEPAPAQPDTQRPRAPAPEGTSATPSEADIQFQQGSRAYQLGNLRQAERAFRKAAELDPDNPNIYNNLGAIYMEQSRWEDAAAAFRRALAGDPEHVKARVNLGGALYNLGRKEEAIQILQEARALAPGDPEVLYALALFLAHSGQQEEAVILLRAAVEADPFNHKIRALEEALAYSGEMLYVAEPEIFLRDRPDRNAVVVGKLRHGEALKVLQREMGWVRVRASSQSDLEGWVSEGVLSQRAPS